jgi:aspartate/methionine/tyrosine aminotransferase
VAPVLGAMTQYMNSGVAGFVQAGAAVALRDGEHVVREIRERCRVGRDLAYHILGRNERLIFGAPPKGGMYVFFALRDEPDSNRACMSILESARVGLAPGHLFGAASQSFIRVCVCRDPGQLGRAFARISEAFA